MLKERAMEDPRSINSPRRILSFSRNRRATVFVDSFPDVDEKASGVGVSEDHGPKSSKVYGFVGSISTVVAAGLLHLYLIISQARSLLGWIKPGLKPSVYVHDKGICSGSLVTFYWDLLLSWYWALARPTYVMVTIALVLLFYVGLNFMATPPPTSLSSMFDEHSKDPLGSVASADEDDQPIEPFSDIGIDQINDLMFN